uniref:BLUF domain-containing protein n=1 Tax=Anas platyrhynchos TaxID=8839 RepID=A0A8B9R3V8_ANAPL
FVNLLSVAAESPQNGTNSTCCWNYHCKQFDKLPVFLLKQGYHRGLFEYASKYNSREPVSGLLLVCSSYVLHVVESCSSTIHLVIRDLASLQDQGPSALLQDIKVAVVAHNIPTRQFPDWNVSVVTSPVTHLEDTTESQPAEGTVTECLNLLFRVAACTPKPAEVSSRYSSCKKCPWLPPHSNGSNLPSPVPLALTHDACSQGRQ